jgi:hypothetical protein
VTDENRTRFFFAANGARADEAANEDERGVRRGARPRGSTRSVANVAAGTGAGASSVSFVKQFILPNQRQKNKFLRYILRAAFFFYGRKILSREEPPAT